MSFPPVDALLPHGPRMIGLETILECSSRSVAITARAGRLEAGRWNHPGDGSFEVPSWAGVELLAQAAAVGNSAAAMCGSEDAAPPKRSGMLIRVRNFRLHERILPIDRTLVVKASWDENVSDAFTVRGSIVAEGDDGKERCLCEGELLILETKGA